MSKLLKKIFGVIKIKKEIRGADELFSNGKIFEARGKELNNILKQLTSDESRNLLRDRNIIRAITVLSIKNNKYNSLVQFFLIILTIFSLWLAWRQLNYSAVQTDYTKKSALPTIIQQNTIIRNAVKYCEENPNSNDSGLSFESGKPATCKDVLSSSQGKKILDE